MAKKKQYPSYGVTDEFKQFSEKYNSNTPTVSDDFAKFADSYHTNGLENTVKTFFPSEEDKKQTNDRLNNGGFGLKPKPSTSTEKRLEDSMKFLTRNTDYKNIKIDDAVKNAPDIKVSPLDKKLMEVGAFSNKAIDSATLGLAPLALSKMAPNVQALRDQLYEENPNSAIAGNIAGYLAPGGAISKGVGKVAAPVLSKIGSNVARTALQEGAVGALMGATEGTTTGLKDNLSYSDIAKNAGKDALMGAGAGAILGGTFEGLGQGYKKLNNALDTRVNNLDLNPFNRPNDSLNTLTKDEIFQQAIDNIRNVKPNLPNDVSVRQSNLKPTTGSGKYNFSTKPYDNAMSEVENAILEAQNRFGTNTLNKAEEEQVRPYIESLLNKAESLQNPRLPDRNLSSLKRASGAASDSQYNLINNINNLDKESYLYANPKAPKLGSEPFIQEPNINSQVPNNNPFKAELSSEIKPNFKPQEKVSNSNYIPNETVQNTSGTNSRRFIENSFMNSEVPKPWMKSEMEYEMPTYERLTNAETWEGAKARVNANADDALNHFRGLDEVGNAHDTALGQALISKAVNDGNYQLANELSIDLAEKLTKAGQAVQAASIFKRLTPDGMLMYANKTLNKVNAANYGKKGFNPISLNEQESKLIVDNMREINSLNEKYQNLIPVDLQLFASQKLAEIQKLIASKIPANIPEKLKAFQRTNLLLNPKTMIRNTLGNALTAGVETVKDIIGGGIDRGLSKITGKRAFLGSGKESLKTQWGGIKRGVKETITDYKTGLDTSPSRTQYDLPTERTISPFGGYEGNSKIVKGLDRFAQKTDEITKSALQLGDRPFYQAAYDDALRKQMKLANTNVATEEMKSFADQIAKERTFQDKNVLTEAFTKLQNGLNKFGNAFTSKVGIDSPNFNLGNIALPFVKTPANILARALDYSPLQVKSVIQEALKGKNMDQYKFVDSLAKGLTGSGLIFAGYMLAEKGILSGKASDDKDKREFDKNIGILPYSISIGDKTYTYDWAQPASIPLAMGADMYNQLKQSKDPSKALLEAGKSGVSTLFSQSLLQGLQKLFGSSYTGANNSFVDNLTNTGFNAVQQLVPFGSALRQVSEITDNVKRDASDNSSMINEKLINPIKSGIPGLRQTLPAKVDTFGKTVPSTGAIETLISPSKIGYKSSTNSQKEITRLFNESGEKKQFPRLVDDKFTYKDKKSGQTKSLELTTEEKNEYQRKLSAAVTKAFEKKINTGEYKKLPDAKKADELSKAMEEANSKIKADIFKHKGIKKK